GGILMDSPFSLLGGERIARNAAGALEPGPLRGRPCHPRERGPRLEARDVRLEYRPSLDRLLHHAPADARADENVRGAESLAEHVRPGRERGLERVQRALVRAVADHAFFHGWTRKRLVDHCGLETARGEEHPAVVRAAQRVVAVGREPRPG